MTTGLRWSEDQLAAHQKRSDKLRHAMPAVPALTTRKYGNEPTNGFDSKRESKRAADLRMMEQAGLITRLVLQPTYELIPKQVDDAGKCVARAITYRADFSYTDRDGNSIVEDSKGAKTEVYLLKRKLMLFALGIQVIET